MIGWYLNRSSASLLLAAIALTGAGCSRPQIAGATAADGSVNEAPIKGADADSADKFARKFFFIISKYNRGADKATEKPAKERIEEAKAHVFKGDIDVWTAAVEKQGLPDIPSELDLQIQINGNKAKAVLTNPGSKVALNMMYIDNRWWVVIPSNHR